MRLEDERVFAIIEPLGFVKTNELFKYVHADIPFAEPFNVIVIPEKEILNKAIDYICVNFFNLGKSFAYNEMENFIKKVKK
jgi:hypothetical protein